MSATNNNKNESYRERLKKDMSEGYLSKSEIKLIDEVCDKAEAYDKSQPSKLEVYYNDKYPKIDILYSGRPIPTIGDRCKIDVRDFFNRYDSEVRKIVESLNLIGKSDDEKSLICLKWILDNIKYVSDTVKGYTEYWQMSFETLQLRTGDCEDFSILLANMLLATSVPYWKIRLTAGLVDDGKGNKGGHCFLVYFCEDKKYWVLLDCTYYPNRLPINQRKEYKDESYYKDTWFSFNERYAYAKDVKDIEKMGGTKNAK